jgi:Sporulation and spore germination
MRRGRPNRLGLVVGLMVAVATLASCGISAESAPRDIELSSEEDSTGRAAVGTGQIFLVQPIAGGAAPMLVSVQRATGGSVGGDPSPVLDVLFDGPNEAEIEGNITTFLPDGLTVVDWSIRSGGVVTIDLPEAFGELTGRSLIFALAQIVHTVTADGRVNGVRITIGGEAREWPDVNSQLQSDPLTVFDYPGLVRSTQPAFPAVPSD